jgi:predicted AAA+ superfamily ATPase
MDITREETLKRELEALSATARYFNIKENFILTHNQEKGYEEAGIIIKAMPAWKWLLQYPLKTVDGPLR